MKPLETDKRIVGRPAFLLLAVLALCGVASSAWAEKYARQDDDRPRETRQAPQSDREEPAYRRDERREAQRPQRMSPEERSQMRRDIKNAGREIYTPHQ